MSDIFQGLSTDPSPAQIRPVSTGDDLYSVSVSELHERLERLEQEIIRTKLALTKKKAELSEAETLFGGKPAPES